MAENKRYFKREWEEEYYIFDSTHISEEKVDEESEYTYNVFADSMQGNEVVDRLNEQEERIKELQQTINTIAKDYEYSHGMDIRNAEWFTAW